MDILYCHLCKKSNPSILATFDFEFTDVEQGRPDDLVFTGLMELLYKTAEGTPVKILETYLDMDLVNYHKILKFAVQF